MDVTTTPVTIAPCSDTFRSLAPAALREAFFCEEEILAK